jgi:hypothetical protein
VHEVEHRVVGVAAPRKRPIGIAEAVAADDERSDAVAVALCDARGDACVVPAECEEDVIRAPQEVVQTRRIAVPAGEALAGEVDPEPVTDGAARAVEAEQVRRSHHLLVSVRVSQGRGDSRRVLGEGDELDLTLDRDADSRDEPASTASSQPATRRAGSDRASRFRRSGKWLIRRSAV